jgi:hypothetical protein
MKFFSEFLKWNSGFLGGGGRTLVQSNLSDRSEASAEPRFLSNYSQKWFSISIGVNKNYYQIINLETILTF